MRLLTILIVVGTCGYAAIFGWEIVGFAIAVEQTRGDVVDTLLGWRDVPGISGAAIEAALSRIPFESGPADAQRRADPSAMLLAVRPLSSTDWLSLAGLRVASGAPNNGFRSALVMSYLAGPNEDIMLQRGIFGVLQWEKLTDADRHRVVRDLAGAVTGNAIPDSGTIKLILDQQSSNVRSDIRTMLGAEQIPAADLGRIGL
jgi:hypothetical protein